MKAQAALITEQGQANRTNSTNVLILLSDGDANQKNPGGRGAQQLIPTAEATNECAQAITAATAAKNAGTWVYAIAYGANTGGRTELRVAALTLPYYFGMYHDAAAIASDSTKFFSDTSAESGAGASCTSAARPITDLNQIFAAIAGDFTSARLIPNSIFQ